MSTWGWGQYFDKVSYKSAKNCGFLKKHVSNFFGPDLKKRNSGKNTLPYRKYGLKGMLETSLPKLKKASFEIEHLLGMISHKKSIITIFGHKHEIKNFIKKFNIFHKRISTAFDFGSYLD